MLPTGWRSTTPCLGYYDVNVDGTTLDRKFGSTAATGSISGIVFRDSDRDGVRDRREARLAGWRVYIDVDNDGMLDGDERFVLSNATGNYTIPGLGLGTYVVRVVSEDGSAVTAPAAGYYAVRLTAKNKRPTGRHFGLAPLA